MSPHRLTAFGAGFVLAGLYLALGACASTSGSRIAAENYPAIHLDLGDFRTEQPDAPLRLVERLDQTAADHCARNGPLLTPARHRTQPAYCIDGVRAELVRSLPPELRALYDRGRSVGAAGAAP
jgi:hypothetical protein